MFQEEEEGGSVSELSMTNVGGIFLVLVLGIVMGAGMAGLEYLVGRCKASKNKITY